MRRGTTPTHIFTVDIDLTDASAVFITYSQLREVVLEKGMDDLTITPEEISVKLTQEDTIAFHDEYDVEIQIAAKFEDGSVIRSQIIRTDVQRILKDEVI